MTSTDPQPQVAQLCEYLEQFAPPDLAEDWDNVGLLVGDRGQPVQRLMTALTITPDVVAEAIKADVQLIVAHHPLPFRPLKRITRDTTAGSLLLDLIAAGIAVYSPHTRFDSAAAGINQQIAERLGLEKIQPIRPCADDGGQLGAGRWGHLPRPLPPEALAQRVAEQLGVTGLHWVSGSKSTIERVAIACGSAGEFLADALQLGCEALVTGETNFHTALEARAQDLTLLLPGHYASERFAVETLAETLQHVFPSVQTWASRVESDPLQWWSVP